MIDFVFDALKVQILKPVLSANVGSRVSVFCPCGLALHIPMLCLVLILSFEKTSVGQVSDTKAIFG